MFRGKGRLNLLFSFLFFCLAGLAQPPVTSPANNPLPPAAPVVQPIIQDPDYLRDLNSSQQKDVKSGSINRDSTRDDGSGKPGAVPIPTYGANALAASPVTDVSELSTPPADYPLGAGDKVVISAYGGAEFQKGYLIGSDGSLFAEGLGKLYIGGLTFENARKLIYSRFINVVPPGTNIDITLGAPRTINVNVVNEVNTPGGITVTAFSNAFNVIQRAGGITENGNLRNIQIKRAGRVIEELDIYRYLQTGDFGRHIYLQNNDFIIVPFYEKKVLATGQFKRPLYYQLRRDEGIRALLKLSGGLNSDALSSGLKVIRTENEEQRIIDVNINSLSGDFLLLDGDIVRADLIRPGFVNKVEVTGEIKYPSVYEIRKGDKLFDLINRAGGITRNTYLKRAYIFRGAGDTTSGVKSQRIEVDLTDIADVNSSANIPLVTNDVIKIFGTYEFSDAEFVDIFGEVRKEARLRKYGGMTLQDLIFLSGGLKPSAEFGRLEISSIVDIDSARNGLKPTRTIVTTYAITQDLNIDSAAAKVLLKPYDQVFVRKNPTFELQQNVEIRGLIKYPGLYPRLNKYEKLSSFIARAGGFAENANLGGAVLYRRKTDLLREKVVGAPQYDTAGNLIAARGAAPSVDEPASIDLYNAIRHPNSKYDVILQENDLIFVPEINPFVTVKGIVQSPLKITFDKEHTHVPFYIDKAGGYGIRPWRKRVFVTYADGKSKRTKNFLFFHFYPRVEEGAYITIPRRPAGQEFAELTRIAITAVIPVVITALILRASN